MGIQKDGYRSARSDHEAKTKQLADQLKSKGYKVGVRTIDAADPASVAALVTNVEREFGAIDVLDCNAASMRKVTLAEQPLDSFNSDLAVNIGGGQAAAKTGVTSMIQRGSGTILLAGGGVGLHPHPDHLSLSIGKVGIRALAQGLFESFKEKSVHVATVTVAAFVDPGTKLADAAAKEFWQLHNQPKDAWAVESVFTP